MEYWLKITLMKEFCAQPLSLAWIMYIQRAELWEDIVTPDQPHRGFPPRPAPRLMG